METVTERRVLDHLAVRFLPTQMSGRFDGVLDDILRTALLGDDRMIVVERGEERDNARDVVLVKIAPDILADADYEVRLVGDVPARVVARMIDAMIEAHDLDAA